MSEDYSNPYVVARCVRGCATDAQYQELIRRIQAYGEAQVTERCDAYREALVTCQGALLAYDGHATDPMLREGWTDPEGYRAYVAAEMALTPALASPTKKQKDKTT